MPRVRAARASAWAWLPVGRRKARGLVVEEALFGGG